MSINILKIKNKTIIPYEIVPLFAGAYVGYNNAHGIDIGTPGEVILYAPIIYAGCVNPCVGFATKKLIPGLEEKLSNELLLKEAGKDTIKSGISIVVGYGIGYLIGHLNK